MKFSLRRLIPFLLLFCQLTTPKTRPNSNSSCVRFSLNSLRTDPQKTPLPLLMRDDSLLQRCVYRTVAYQRARRGSTENTTSCIDAWCFTAAEMCLPHSCLPKSAAWTHKKRRLQHLLYCCVTSQRTWRIPMLRVYGPLSSNGYFSGSTVLALSKYGLHPVVYVTTM
jgi:hypothetical protein